MDRYKTWLEEPTYFDCMHCQSRIHGTNGDIDSGIRKHLEYCEPYQRYRDSIVDAGE